MSMHDAQNAQRHSTVAAAHAHAEAAQPRRQLHGLVPTAMQRMNSEWVQIHCCCVKWIALFRF